MNMTPEERQEYEAMLVSEYGFKPDEASEYTNEQLGAVSQEGSSDTSKLMKALGYVGSGLDYAGGLARVGAAEIADQFTDENQVTQDDLMKALKGEGPNTAEYMDRFGVPEGASVDTPLGKINVRDAAGFVGDVALDPLTYLTFGGASGAKAALKGGAKGLQKTGKAMHASGFKNIDKVLERAGTTPLSDVLWKNKISGTNKSVLKKVGSLDQKLKSAREKLYSQVNDAGIKVDSYKAMDRAKDAVARISTDRQNPELAKKLDKVIDRYVGEAGMDIVDASYMKSNLANKLPKGVYKNDGYLTSEGIEFKKAAAKGLREEILNAGEKVRPGLGKEIDKVNDTWATLIEARKPLQKQVDKATTKNPFTVVDSMIVGTSGFTNPLSAGGMLAIKKGAELANTTLVRSKTGLGLDRLGRGVNWGADLIPNLGHSPGGVARQVLNRTPTVWDNISKEEE